MKEFIIAVSAFFFPSAESLPVCPEVRTEITESTALAWEEVKDAPRCRAKPEEFWSWYHAARCSDG